MPCVCPFEPMPQHGAKGFCAASCSATGGDGIKFTISCITVTSAGMSSGQALQGESAGAVYVISLRWSSICDQFKMGTV